MSSIEEEIQRIKQRDQQEEYEELKDEVEVLRKENDRLLSILDDIKDLCP